MLSGRIDTRQKARTLTIPAPVGGLNGRDGLAAMGPQDAFVMDNWFPGTATVDGRNGHEAHILGLVNPVETILAYNGGASRKMLAFAGGSIFDTTITNAVAGSELIANGDFDAPLAGWNGTAGATPSIETNRLKVTAIAVHPTATFSFFLVFGLTIGQTYRFRTTMALGTGTPPRLSLAGAVTATFLYSTSPDIDFTFVAAGAVLQINAELSDGVTWATTIGDHAYFDNMHLNTIGAVPAPIQSGRSSNKIISTMFSNAGSQFLIGVSGLDVPFSYDGTTVTNLTMTGMTGSAANLSYVFAFKGRLYFAQKDQLGFYYLAVGAIQGALAYFDLSQIAKLGGYLVAIASFSADSGNGPADYVVFITSMGEYIVYAGFDPSSASNFGLVGRYYSAPPIGRNCTVNYGSDLIVLTLEGALPFSAIRREGGISENDAITYKLGRYLLDNNIYATVHGWQAVLYPRGGMLVINVPETASETGNYGQFVQNTATKAWTHFSGQNGICWCVFEGRLYFGKSDGTVKLADEGKLDDGNPIQLECKQAYNYFDDGNGSGPSNKHFHFAKLLMGCDGTPPISAQFNVDYMEDQPEYIDIPPDEGSFWDIATWDLAPWGIDVTTRFVMVSTGKYGVAGSLWLRASVQGLALKWYATQYIFSKAAGVL